MQRPAERSGDRGFGLGLRESRHLVLQSLQIVRKRGADHVRPGRQKLAKLDVARAEPRERGRQPYLGGTARRPLDQSHHPDQRPHRRWYSYRVDYAEHALASKNKAGMAKADETRERGDHWARPRRKRLLSP